MLVAGSEDPQQRRNNRHLGISWWLYEGSILPSTYFVCTVTMVDAT
jgi:hypothetical protein